MKVYILTRHTGKEPIFGAATCVFNTLKIGFPNAEVIVADNNSKECGLIYRAATQVTSHFRRYFEEIGHWKFIEDAIEENTGPICFIDPDVIFYENVEEKLENIRELIAGRYCPPFYNPVFHTNEVSRLHTSLLYIRSCARLKEIVKNKFRQTNYSVSPYQGFFSWFRHTQYFYDTFANVSHQVVDQYHFGPDILDSYTHLVSGSMLAEVAAGVGERLIELHKIAEQDPNAVRGLWKEHDRFYALHPVC